MEVVCCKGPPGFETICDPAFWPYNEKNGCDVVMKNYCETNIYDPVCSCINSDKPFPQCQDTACQKEGYIPSSLRSIKCPSIVNCSQNTSNIEANTGGEIKLNQIQICGDDPKIKEILAKEGEKGILTVIDKAYDVQLEESKKSSNVNFNMYYTILAFILILIIIITTAYRINNIGNVGR